jgi:hypothetical protein
VTSNVNSIIRAQERMREKEREREVCDFRWTFEHF